MPTITEVLRDAKIRQIDSEVLLAHVLDKSRTWIYTWSEFIISQQQLKKFQHLVKLRQTGMPVAYLTGHKEFCSLNFTVTKDTLIPRPETEMLIEIVLENIKKDSKILELGTGSGALAIALGKECKTCQITATDTSDAALAVASENSTVHKTKNVRFIKSNWFANLGHEKFDLIVSNPPYVAETEKHLLDEEINFEPAIALFSGQDGLNAIREIIKNAKQHLNTSAAIILEHGFSQSQKVKDLFMANNYNKIQSFKDQQSHIRFTKATG